MHCPKAWSYRSPQGLQGHRRSGADGARTSNCFALSSTSSFSTSVSFCCSTSHDISSRHPSQASSSLACVVAIMNFVLGALTLPWEPCSLVQEGYNAFLWASPPCLPGCDRRLDLRSAAWLYPGFACLLRDGSLGCPSPGLSLERGNLQRCMPQTSFFCDLSVPDRHLDPCHPEGLRPRLRLQWTAPGHSAASSLCPGSCAAWPVRPRPHAARPGRS